MSCRVVILALLTGIAAATPAIARDHAWYAGIEGGATMLRPFDDQIEHLRKVPVTTVNGTTIRLVPEVFADDPSRITSKIGYDVDAILGYDFGLIRAEAELGYKRAPMKRGRLCLPDCGPSRSLAGKDTALSRMANVLLDLRAGDRLNFSLGGGVGVARVSTETARLGPSSADQSKFAWQALAEARYALTDHFDLGLKYRYFDVDRVHYKVDSDSMLTTFNFNWHSHSLLASLIYNFGEPAARTAP